MKNWIIIFISYSFLLACKHNKANETIDDCALLNTFLQDKKLAEYKEVWLMVAIKCHKQEEKMIKQKTNSDILIIYNRTVYNFDNIKQKNYVGFEESELMKYNLFGVDDYKIILDEKGDCKREELILK